MSKKQKFITAYDPEIGKRVPFEVHGKHAISLVSGSKFKYKL